MRHGRLLRVSAVLIAEVAAIALVVRLGSVGGFAFPTRRPVEWLFTAPAEDVFAVALRGGALLALGWLTLLTVLHGSAAATGHPGLRRLALRSTPLRLRRGFERLVAIGAIAGGSFTVAGAPVVRAPATPPPVVRSPVATTASTNAPTGPPTHAPTTTVAVRDARAPVTRLGPSPTTTASATTAPATTTAPVGRASSRDSPSPGTDAGTRHHVVTPGESLWTIAARRAAEVAPAGTDDHRIARYWLEVVTRNRATLRSGNPNLIYPGEVVELPPLDAATSISG